MVLIYPCWGKGRGEISYRPLFFLLTASNIRCIHDLFELRNRRECPKNGDVSPTSLPVHSPYGRNPGFHELGFLLSGESAAFDGFNLLGFALGNLFIDGKAFGISDELTFFIELEAGETDAFERHQNSRLALGPLC